jgi:(2Fe-2S) ferredoxin
MAMEIKEKPVYFTMKMQDWYLNLNPEDKVRVVNELAKDSPDDRSVTDEELLALMPEAEE